jgi:hypothetical protein
MKELKIMRGQHKLSNPFLPLLFCTGDFVQISHGEGR